MGGDAAAGTALPLAMPAPAARRSLSLRPPAVAEWLRKIVASRLFTSSGYVTQ